ncbi:hypothetical protein PIIN_10046 [Serendipita indica DSM 11827]|uniref:Uncharacterized protein n=1 Tax=Serendipita indica (strain DSM 11827) TaxID=1109443 RepID=G4TXK3_SERID|nr:hypothetical protein PIIN_10046 [Serendipita indica DSM 11827]
MADEEAKKAIAEGRANQTNTRDGCESTPNKPFRHKLGDQKASGRSTRTMESNAPWCPHCREGAMKAYCTWYKSAQNTTSPEQNGDKTSVKPGEHKARGNRARAKTHAKRGNPARRPYGKPHHHHHLQASLTTRSQRRELMIHQRQTKGTHV